MLITGCLSLYITILCGQSWCSMCTNNHFIFRRWNFCVSFECRLWLLHTSKFICITIFRRLCIVIDNLSEIILGNTLLSCIKWIHWIVFSHYSGQISLRAKSLTLLHMITHICNIGYWSWSLSDKRISHHLPSFLKLISTQLILLLKLKDPIFELLFVLLLILKWKLTILLIELLNFLPNLRNSVAQHCFHL